MHDDALDHTQVAIPDEPVSGDGVRAQARPRRLGRFEHRGSSLIGDLLERRAGEAMALADRYLNPQLGRTVRTLGFDRCWSRGEGAHLIDEHGERYLDLIGGHGVFALGRNHPDIVEAIETTLAARTPNLVQLGVPVLAAAFAEALVERAPASIDAMIPANSGTEAVEAAIKLARASTGRERIVYAERGFHGLTLGSLSLNGHAAFRDGFGPFVPGCRSVPFGDTDALERELAHRDVAAFVVEPIQGKGVNLPPNGYLNDAQRLCRAAGTLFVCDEVQTGFGRTGRLFALEHWNLEPDMICLAKALSGGLIPTGALLVSRRVIDAVFDDMEHGARHSSTFGGNDLAAAAGLATLHVLERDGIVAHARRMGELLLELTRPLVERYEIVRDVRGLGLMWAIELGPPSGPAARSLWRAVERAQPGLFAQAIVLPLFHDHRVLCQVAGHRMNVVKALPALVVEEAEIRRFADALDDVASKAERVPSACGRLLLRMARYAARPSRSDALIHSSDGRSWSRRRVTRANARPAETL